MTTLERFRPHGRRQVIVTLAVVVALVGAGFVGMSVLGRSDPVNDRDSRQRLAQALGGDASRTAGATGGDAEPPALAPAARDLVALVEKGRATGYYARYAVSSSSEERRTTDVWRRPPLLRQDSETGTNRPLSQTRVLLLTTGVVGCVQPPGGAWACSTRPDLSARSADLFAPPEAGQLAGLPVTVQEQSIGGRDARCFTVGANQSSTELCLSASGIPLRLVSGGSRMEVQELDEVDPAETVFEPPADPTAPVPAPPPVSSPPPPPPVGQPAPPLPPRNP